MKGTCGLSILGALLLLQAACAPAATPTPLATPVPVATPTLAGVVATATPTAMPQREATATPTPKLAATPTKPPDVGPKYGGTLFKGMPAEPPGWDFIFAAGDPINSSHSLVFTNLFTWWSDPPQDCQRGNYPLAVESWRWLDDTTVEFTLKQGIRYHNKPPVNGREMVAADVVSSFERYRKMSRMETQSKMVSSISGTGKYSFQMKLSIPWGGLITEMLAYKYGVWVEPPEAGGPEGKLWGQPEKSWVGSGPFVFEKWLSGVKWTYLRNPDYFIKGLPYLERVEYVLMQDSSTQAAALRSGKIEMLYMLPAVLQPEVKKAVPGLQVKTCPGVLQSGAGNLVMSTRAPPFDDVRVRRAVSMAIDQDFLRKALYMGDAAPGHIAAPGMQYGLAVEDLPPEVRQYFEYHPDRARRLLAEAGYKDGFDTVINWTWGRYAHPADRVAEAITATLSEVGIRAKLNLMTYAVYTDIVFQNKYPDGQMALGPTTQYTPEDAHGMSAFWSKGSRNWSRVQNAKYDELFERFLVSKSDAERRELVAQMQIMAAENVWRIILPLGKSTLTAAPGIHYIWPGNTSNFGMILGTAWKE